MTRHLIRRVRVGSKTTVECDCGRVFVAATRTHAFDRQIAHALDALKAPSVFASLDEARAT